LEKYVNEVIKGKEIKFLGFLPQDPTILKYELEKKPVFEWESPLKTEAFKLFEKLFN